MNREFLFECYDSDKGRILQKYETDFLRHAINVSYRQTILQIGGLGFEQDFIDASLYKRYFIVDSNTSFAHPDIKTIHSLLDLLPVQSESIDLVIMPHSLEFELDQHQALREIERVLKPEAVLLLINFNPWSHWVRYRHLFHVGKIDPIMKTLIRRSKIIDWLKLLNFENEIVAGFRFRSSGKYSKRLQKSPFIVSYAVKAIKRRYNIIPLTPAKAFKLKFALAGGMERRPSFKQ